MALAGLLSGLSQCLHKPASWPQIGMQGTRTPKFRGIRKHDGQVVKAGTVLVRQVGKVFYPGQNVKLGRDYSLQAKCEGFVRFYWDRKYGPRQESLAKKKIKRYCGIVFNPNDQLPRDEEAEGSARRFSSVDRGLLADYLQDRGARTDSSASVKSAPYSKTPPPPNAFIEWSTEDAAEASQAERQPGPMTQRELDIADLMLKRTAVAGDGLPAFSNVRRAFGMPPKPRAALALGRGARDELAALNASSSRLQRRVERDIAFSAVSTSEMEAIRARQDTDSRRALPIISSSSRQGQAVPSRGASA